MNPILGVRILTYVLIIGLAHTQSRTSRCGSNCMSCNGYTCNSCYSGYYPVGSSCYSCSNGCSSCITGTLCNTCKSGYFMSNYRCLSCISGCMSCQNSVSCLKCSDGYYPIRNGVSISSCGSCISNCRSCIGPTDCSACNSLFKLQDGKCVTDAVAVVIWIGVCAFCICFIIVTIGVACFFYHESEKKRRRANEFFDNNYNNIDTDLGYKHPQGYIPPPPMNTHQPYNPDPAYISPPPPVNQSPYPPQGYSNYTGAGTTGY